MGFVSDLIVKGVTKIAKKQVTTAVVKTAAVAVFEKGQKKIDVTNNKKVEKFLQESGLHSRLILRQKAYTFKEDFSIFDENKNIKYVCKGKTFSLMHELSIYEASGKKKLAEVKQSLFGKSFVLKIDGKKIGKIKRKRAFAKRKYKLDFNDWTIEKNVLGLKYKITDKEELVMQVFEKLWFGGDTYFLDIVDSKNELLCLMIALAIDCSRSSKAKDNKKTFNHKF